MQVAVEVQEVMHQQADQAAVAQVLVIQLWPAQEQSIQAQAVVVVLALMHLKPVVPDLLF
jgi:hypothetical protein